MPKTEAVLKVVEALQQDVSYGRARLDGQTRVELQLSPGDIIEIRGSKTTSAVVWRSHPGDEGKGIIHIDNLTRKNAGVGIGDKVTIRKADVKPAKTVTLAPAISEEQQIQFGEGIETLTKRGLLKRPVVEGDIVVVPNIALFGNALPFSVVRRASSSSTRTPRSVSAKRRPPRTRWKAPASRTRTSAASRTRCRRCAR